MVPDGGSSDEAVDGGEGVGGRDVDCGEGGGEVGVRGEEGEVEEEEDEAVFSAVVGEGEGGEAGRVVHVSALKSFWRMEGGSVGVVGRGKDCVVVVGSLLTGIYRAPPVLSTANAGIAIARSVISPPGSLLVGRIRSSGAGSDRGCGEGGRRHW